MEESLLLKIAKDAIRSQFDHNNLDKEELLKKHPKLQEKGAVFVTLTIDGNLRGCVGSLIAHRTLLDDIIQNAKTAAFEDSRFAPLSKEEFQKIHIEISLLSTPKKLLYETKEDLKNKIKLNIDGVILKDGFNQATFLPQVWEQLPSFELFFAHLCQKAGMSEECLENHPEIFVYQVKKI
jgi:hypothetical protein